MTINPSKRISAKVPVCHDKQKASAVPHLQIDTSGVNNISKSPSSAGSSFRVLRKEGHEIDFDKRRKSPYEAKAPKIIANIYSSSMSDLKKSPISASTILALKDDHGLKITTIKLVLRMFSTVLVERIQLLQRELRRHHLVIERSRSRDRTRFLRIDHGQFQQRVLLRIVSLQTVVWVARKVVTSPSAIVKMHFCETNDKEERVSGKEESSTSSSKAEEEEDESDDDFLLNLLRDNLHQLQLKILILMTMRIFCQANKQETFKNEYSSTRGGSIQ